MGFNTVVFLLNDMMHEVERSPRSTTFLITHPDFSNNYPGRDRRRDVASGFGEPRVTEQALNVLPTFHADCMKVFLAGGNNIQELQVLRTGRTKEGKPTITVEAPEWFNKKGNFQFMLNMKPRNRT